MSKINGLKIFIVSWFFLQIFVACEKKDSVYSITYEALDATSGKVPEDSEFYHLDDKAELLYPRGLEKENYLFDSWSYGEETFHAGEEIKIGDSDIVLSAIWKEEVGIGDYAYGGIVFYILQLGDIGFIDGEIHGLVAAIYDQNNGDSVPWAKEITQLASFDTLIGTGYQNTLKIVDDQGEGFYAAKLCNDLELYGYYSWFLPSLCELKEMYENKMIINRISEYNGGSGFDSTIYWSSTAAGSEYGAVYFPFDCSTDFKTSNKLAAYRVRAIRSF